MPDKTLIVILDTNLWISFLISKNIRKVDQLLERNIIRLLFSQESLEEFMDVRNRPKFEKYFSYPDVLKLLELFDQYGTMVLVNSKVNACRDHKDNFLLALAKDGNADYLVTGDTDLLILKKFGKTNIISLKGFMQKFIDSKFKN